MTLSSPFVNILRRLLIEEAEQSGRIITEDVDRRGEMMVGLNIDSKYLLTGISSFSQEIIVESVGRLDRQVDTDLIFLTWSPSSA